MEKLSCALFNYAFYLLKALRELARKHPSVITIIRLGKCACVLLGAFKIFLEMELENFKDIFLWFLNTISLPDTLGLMFVMLLLDADDPSSVKESAKKWDLYWETTV